MHLEDRACWCPCGILSTLVVPLYGGLDGGNVSFDANHLWYCVKSETHDGSSVGFFDYRVNRYHFVP